MSQDISYWLTEVKTLQQQLAEVKHDRDQAYQDAANWQQRYHTEAQQRQADIRSFQAEIARLRGEIAQLQGDSGLAEGILGSGVVEGDDLGSDLEGVKDPDLLRQQLNQVRGERDRLFRALQQEHQAHAQTRQNLTLALSDAVDGLRS
jgi:chromosome segregation ATPase